MTADPSPPLETDPWALSTERRGFTKESFEGPTRLLPELEIFGWLHFSAALPGALRPDRHEGLYEIHYMRRGHVKWWVEDESHDLSPGSVFVIRPGENHGGEGASLQPCEHYWLRIGFTPGKALPALTLEETEQLRTHFESISLRNFVASPEVGELFVRMHEEHRSSSQPHGVTLARALLHTLLVTLLRDHNRCIQPTSRQSLTTWRVRRAIDLLTERLFEPGLRIEDIAVEVGASQSGLRSRFRAETGYSIHEFVLLHRIEEAKVRLAAPGKEITTIAYDLGFSSSQYFATTFRRYTGMSPGEYRRRLAAP